MFYLPKETRLCGDNVLVRPYSATMGAARCVVGALLGCLRLRESQRNNRD